MFHEKKFYMYYFQDSFVCDPIVSQKSQWKVFRDSMKASINESLTLNRNKTRI